MKIEEQKNKHQKYSFVEHNHTLVWECSAVFFRRGDLSTLRSCLLCSYVPVTNIFSRVPSSYMTGKATVFLASGAKSDSLPPLHSGSCQAVWKKTDACSVALESFMQILLKIYKWL